MPRAVHVVSRLSVGGSVQQAILTAAYLRGLGWEVTLVHGQPQPHEGSMAALADRLGLDRIILPGLQRELGARDALAVYDARRLLASLRPDVVHTHAAKAGAVGRLSARLAGVAVVVHTFHGHVLRGYFGPARERGFRLVERGLTHLASRIVAVSEQVRDDLVELRVAAPGRIDVIPVGFEMDRLVLGAAEHDALRARTRAELGLGDEQVVLFVGRLVPIKRVDRFLAAARLLADRPGTVFVIVGDGEQRAALAGSGDARLLGTSVRFLGYRDDLPAIYHAADLAVLCSDAEGTPVSLIEAGACGLPVVATDVGGVRSVVTPETGVVVAAGDVTGLATAMRTVLDAPQLARRLGGCGQARARQAFAVERLAADHDRLYRRLLARR
jgi:glycosyltransferase involved in cell wall biosynthesis